MSTRRPPGGGSIYVLVCVLLSVAAGALLGAPEAVAAACPSAATPAVTQSFELPECRAWELVTPPYTEGMPVAGPNGMFAVSPDGSHLIGSSFGTFAAAEEGEPNPDSPLPGTAYEFSRTATGWEAYALGPPQSAYASAGMYDASANLEGTLWELGKTSQPEGVTDFYIERPRGTFVEIGPATPAPDSDNTGSYTYEGASADLSHVLFTTASGYRWPFDRTAAGASTLYEYLGTGNSAPSLVGVSGGDGSTELVSECGTLLGSSSPQQADGSMYNAISASGTRVFFTAVGADDEACGGRQPPVDELLAREEVPAGEARTVAISEPSLSYCSATPAPPCADAHFEGASEDGSKVFFTSTQKLLPEAGAGKSNLYEYDFAAPAGANLTLASTGATPAESAGAEVQGVARISEDGSHVYFVAKGVLSTTANAFGDVAVAGGDNLYVYEREGLLAGHTAFIATLSSADGRDWAPADDRPVLASADGRYLVFTSVADLTHEGTAPGVAQVFRYDAQTGSLVRASIGERGDTDGAALTTQPIDRFDSPTSTTSLPAPEDGVVFFESTDALVPQATSGGPFIYEYDAGEVSLITGGAQPSAVAGVPHLLGSDPSGDDVYFTTTERLVFQDTSTQQGIYDARVAGGFSTPQPRPPCETADSCREAPSPQPILPVAGSAAQGAATGSAAQGGATGNAVQGGATGNAVQGNAAGSAEQTPFGIADFDMQVLDADGTPQTQAGAHPYALTTSFSFTTGNQAGSSGAAYPPAEDIKDVVLDLPLGLLADPAAAPQCPLYALQIAGGGSACPADSRIGSLVLEESGGTFGQSAGQGSETTAVYNMTPESGYPLELGASYPGHAVVMYGSIVRQASGEVLRLAVPGMTSTGVSGASLTLFGDPAEHDGSAGAAEAFLTNPGACSADPAPARLEVDTWQHPGEYQAAEATLFPEATGCSRLAFQPTLQVTPDVAVTDTPSGYTIDIDNPQPGDPAGLAMAELKQAAVTLPTGVSLSPATADGLLSCAATGPEGINIGGEDVSPSGQDLGDPEASELGAGYPGGDGSAYADGLYHTAPGHCPEASAVGTVEIATPLLAQPLNGRLFLAESGAIDGSPYGLYLEVSGSGIIVKLAGTLSANPTTGQLTLVFKELPQLPFSELKLHLFGGERALLANPQECGPATSSGVLSPWSSPETENVTLSSAFSVDKGYYGEACPNTLPFEPRLNAGTITAAAGSFSPFTLTISRADNQQYLSRFTVQLPPGLVWMLSSVPQCGEPHASDGTCPSTSEIGTTAVAVGTGDDPFWLHGSVYLTAGYGGAQYGLSISLPAVAGPFDLGEAITRAAIAVDPSTGALTITSDPLPQILDGVPLRIRTLNLTIDRPEFVLNPTACASRQIAATIESTEGASVEVSNPFLTTGCQPLPVNNPPTPTPGPKNGEGPPGSGTPPPKPLPKPSISRVRTKLSGAHLDLVFTTSAGGSVTITGRGIRRYRKNLRAGAHTIEVRLNKRGAFDSRHRRRLELELTLETASGTGSTTAVFET